MMYRPPAGMTCAACRRGFSNIDVFDAHQDWDMSREPALICRDPATMLKKDGTPRFVTNRYGLWGKYQPESTGGAHWARARSRQVTTAAEPAEKV